MATVPRHLFVTSRHDAALAAYLRKYFSGEPAVEIQIDRRGGERRRLVAVPPVERRHAERRARPEVDLRLRSTSCAFVTLPSVP